MHTCCGPCFTIPFQELQPFFKISVMYNNSNIYPKEEYIRRLEELKRYLAEIGSDIELIEEPYDNATYMKDLIKYGDMPEGHERCRACFRKRLSAGFDYAESHGFDYYGTVMTISRYKNAQDINSIGEELEKNHCYTKWLFADFKKDNGYEQSLLIIKEHQMYFQEYCGCIYSYQKYQEKKVKNNK
ncbi:MAG TPA: epoxyqueuosine reductase QueH [Bacilli bacterium]|nr:epoxyqueuosine reductase QueH [Bacilli bacterium]HPS19143.1 epoxyqueuosine reductase QueH [Bacilli bacterium]